MVGAMTKTDETKATVKLTLADVARERGGVAVKTGVRAGESTDRWKILSGGNP